MPELPEIYCRAAEMNKELPGKTIRSIEILQPKCLNVSQDRFIAALTGAKINEVGYRGKWIFVETSRGWLLLNLGMGGEISLRPAREAPEKRRLSFLFTSGDCLSINFSWFGYAHYVPLGQLESHSMTAKLGRNAIDLCCGELHELIKGQRGTVKSFLLDQTKIAGIGNAYVHDILFLARLHPLRRPSTLSEIEIDCLGKAIHDGLQPSIDKGGAFYERNLYGQPGGFQMGDIIIGYREGQSCPMCATTIIKIKTGSTSSFICPICQPLQP